jgi:hypothetical protein
MGDGDKAVPFGPQNVPNAPRPHQKKILSACKQRADQYVEGLFKQVSDKLDDVLFNRSNNSGSEGDSDIHLEAARELRRKRPDIASSFLSKFTQIYQSRLNYETFAGPSKKENAHGGGLSLVDEQELEESLAVDGLVAKAKDRLRNELYTLAQRFNLLVEGARYDEEMQPFGPDSISYAFRDVFQELELKVEIKLIAYKLFEQGLLQTLGEFYQQLNILLSDAGILPDLKSGLSMRSTGGTAQVRSAKTTEEQLPDGFHSSPTGGMQGGATTPSDIYQTLQQLMNTRKFGVASGDGASGGMSGGNGGMAGAAMSAGPSLPAGDLVRGLSLLQQNPLPSDPGGVFNVTVIKDTLLEQMRQFGDARGIHPAHDNTIDVIGMIFEFILGEPSIPDVVKALLNKLQIPILKVAIVDKEFFTNKTHPARRLLNVLGHASIGWNDNAEEARQQRFQKMEYVVNRVLAEFEQDPGIFTELLVEFTEFLRKEGGDIDAEQTSPLSEETKEEPSDRLAFETIESRLEGAEVPAILRDFLRNVWRDVLQHALDESGYESEGWRRSEQVVDDLMWSMEPKTTSDDRRKMVMLLPRLLDSLREGMTLVGSAQSEMDAVIDALEPIHMACLRGEKPGLETIKPKPVKLERTRNEASFEDVANMIHSIQEGMRQGADPSTSVEAASATNDLSDLEKELLGTTVSLGPDREEDEQSNAEAPVIEDQYTAAAAEMKLGTWLEFDTENKKRRGKLAWKSVVMGEYVFVDRRYKVVAERTLATLAADLRQGRASPVENVAMFDRALDKVLNGLMSGGRTTH